MVHKGLNNADAFVAGDFMRTYENLVTDLLEDNVRVMVYVGVGMPASPFPLDTRAFTGCSALPWKPNHHHCHNSEGTSCAGSWYSAVIQICLTHEGYGTYWI